MKRLESYIGINIPFVDIDESSELDALVEKAQETKSMPFPERLEAVKQLVLESMVNAFDASLQTRIRDKFGTDSEGNEIVSPGNAEEIKLYRDIVRNMYPLSYALKNRAASCRDQSALFFLLGYEADLGDRHFIQYMRLGPVDATFNDVVSDGKLHRVNLFAESFVYQKIDAQSLEEAGIYDLMHQELPGHRFFSYHRNKLGNLVLISHPTKHIKHYNG